MKRLGKLEGTYISENKEKVLVITGSKTFVRDLKFNHNINFVELKNLENLSYYLNKLIKDNAKKIN